MESLCTPDYQQDRLCVENPNASTCEWIWTHPTYLAWAENTRSSVLHVIGKPGSGKTVLSKHIFEGLNNTAIRDPEIGRHCELLFYFCDNRKRPKESSSTILRGLIHQFLSKRPSLLDSLVERSDVMDSHPFSTTSQSWSLAALWKIFTIIMSDSQLQRVYCVIDALDECDYASTEELLAFLPELTGPPTTGNTKVKVFFTSRPYEHILEGLSCSLSIRIDPEIVKPDIDRIVSDRL